MKMNAKKKDGNVIIRALSPLPPPAGTGDLEGLNLLQPRLKQQL